MRAMIDNDRLEDLAILYELISRVDKDKTTLKHILAKRVIDLGVEIEKVLKETDFSIPMADGPEGTGDGPTKSAPLNASAQQTAAAIKWVTDILALKEKFDRLWTECFEKDLVVQTAITSSFTELFRLCQRSAEYVSLFIDDSFKRGLRGKSDEEVDEFLDKATTMIRHVTEKDMFERYYQKHLARRLLHNKSENPEAEKQMLSRMQSELGKSFTSKFEGMFKDMTTSEELTRDYQEYVHKNLGGSEGKADLGINVLTSNNWPSEVMGYASQTKGGAATCNYPPEIKQLQESFSNFYNRDRSGRILTWVGSAGTADVRCWFPKVPGQEKGPLSKDRRYELNVSTYGMVVLTLFNQDSDAVLTLEDIEAETNIPHNELVRAVASLSIPPKCRVLRKVPDTKNVKPGDKFSINNAFVSKMVKIKVPVINAISKVEGDEERKATEEKNDETRNNVVNAAIVRIMKYVSAHIRLEIALDANLDFGRQRKELSHTNLTSEVIQQLASRFQPDVPMVKRRIEDLIAREYLERIEDSAVPSYRYLA